MSSKRYSLECPWCGQTFIAKSTIAKWCSDYCRKQALYGSVCADCGGHVSYSGRKPSERCLDCARAKANADARANLLGEIRRWARLYGVAPTSYDWNLPFVRWQQKAYSEGRSTGRLAAETVKTIERRHADAGPWPHVIQVQRIFGSWNAGIEAAGFDACRSGGGRRRKVAA